MNFDIKKLKKWRLFLLFAVIATALWYINKLEYNYKTEVRLPIRLTLDPNSIGWVENPEFEVLCMVDAKGGDILRHNANINYFIDIPVSSLSLESVGSERYKISTTSFKEALSAVQAKLHIVQLIDTLPKLKIIPFQTATLPIKSNINIDCQRQFMVVGGVTFNPATVNVRAPRTVLDTLKSIDTDYLELDNLNKSLSSNISLRSPSNVILSQSTVRYNINVAGYTELEYNLSVDVENLPEGKNVLTTPSMVNVLIKIPLSSFNNDNLHNPIATINYIELLHKRSNLLKVKIDSIPNGGEITRITPEFVEPLFYRK